MIINHRTSWLREVPSEWRVTTIGSLYSLRNEKVSDKDYQPLSVTMKGIVPQLDSAAKTDDGDNRKLVRVGDFAINSRSDRRGSCGISSYDGSVSLINTILTPRVEMNPGYYNWLFHTIAFADEFYKWGHGIVNDLWTTRWQEMKRILIPAPSLAEQVAIAAYLDEQCAIIDVAISEAKVTIEELRAWRASIIFSAVTIGLNDKVELRNSGIEWAERIPQMWQTRRLSAVNYIRARLGWKGLKAEEYVETGYPFLSAYNILNDSLCWSPLNYITQERYDESPEIKLSVGDIILVKDGAGIGKCARIDSLPLGQVTVNSSLAVITPIEEIDYRYEYYYLISPLFSNIIARLRNGMGVPHLTQEAMKEISIPVPPISEQRQIAEYLDRRIAEVNELIHVKEQLITDLEEYRKSLIYDAVTGKRKVV